MVCCSDKHIWNNDSVFWWKRVDLSNEKFEIEKCQLPWLALDFDDSDEDSETDGNVCNGFHDDDVDEVDDRLLIFIK